MKTLGVNKSGKREAVEAYLFLIPLIFGLIKFFLIPLAKSFLFSISKVTASASGYIIKPEGPGYYLSVLTEHTSYRQTAAQAVINMLLTVPLIIGFSFFMASILNQKFKGRTLFRIVLFVPVIVMMSAGGANVLEGQMSGFSDYKDAFGTASVSLTSQISEYLSGIGVDKSLSDGIIQVADQVYDIINLSGIQILIMLTGMQSISPSLYEAAKVEGGASWEIFWKITFPMVSPLVLTCTVYTIIDSFTGVKNGMMDLIQVTAFGSQKYSLASAMSWIYFLVVIVIVAAITKLLSRFAFYYDK